MSVSQSHVPESLGVDGPYPWVELAPVNHHASTAPAPRRLGRRSRFRPGGVTCSPGLEHFEQIGKWHVVFVAAARRRR